MLDHLRDMIEALVYDAMLNGSLTAQEAEQIEYELSGFEPEAGHLLLDAIRRSRQQLKEMETARGHRTRV